jgi:hypothetical protein
LRFAPSAQSSNPGYKPGVFMTPRNLLNGGQLIVDLDLPRFRGEL